MVKQATHKLTGATLAIKVYEKFKLNNSSRRKAVVRELTALRKSNGHQNIIKLYDVIESPKQICLVLEYAKGQMLSSAMSPPEEMSPYGLQPLDDSATEKIFNQVLLALDFIHKK